MCFFFIIIINIIVKSIKIHIYAFQEKSRKHGEKNAIKVLKISKM